MIMLFENSLQQKLEPVKVLKYDSSNPGNGLAVCPSCKEELFGEDHEWRCKRDHNFLGPVE